METIFVLLPLALLIATIAVGLFIWAAKTGQFDDLDTPAVRILFDDEEPRRPAKAHAAPVPPATAGVAVPLNNSSETTKTESTRRASE
ncbi:MAG TPA: cbb3-type cytochrome oxidase assembly protein CcoS [Thermoanaerobaculia bacterium]|nr:cbb3-type cytochrome oxidase assembly protein CcoS [Thermoanaerobaculia bacterium]